MSLTAPVVQENRSTARVRAPGWAAIEYAESVVKSDRLYDISGAGIALFLDFQLPLRQTCRLRLSVFRHGKVHRLDVQARCMYATLVGVHGFRHGFAFNSMSDQDRELLTQLIA